MFNSTLLLVSVWVNPWCGVFPSNINKLFSIDGITISLSSINKTVPPLQVVKLYTTVVYLSNSGKSVCVEWYIFLPCLVYKFAFILSKSNLFDKIFAFKTIGEISLNNLEAIPSPSSL